MSDSTSGGQSTSRRTFVNALLGTSLLGWLGAVIYPVLRYLKPLQLPGGGGPLRLTRTETDRLEREHFVILRAGAKRVLVFEDKEQRLRALDAKCTHEGCTVQYVPGESLIWCACHNGRFDLDGRVISGPPPRPLNPYTASRDGQGNVVVTTETA